MGFYIRKSVRVGPLRFNLSKSGIGVSAGIPGFRVGMGPRGNYIHAGRGGFYYRATLPSGRSTRTAPSQSGTRYTHAIPTTDPTLGPEVAIDSGSVLAMRDESAADLLAELNEKRQRWRVWPIVLVVSALGLVGSWNQLDQVGQIALTVAVVIAIAGVFLWDTMRKTTVIMYDLDADAAQSFQGLIDALNRIGQANRLWHVGSTMTVLDRKYHAGAASELKRTATTIRVGGMPFVKCNIGVPTLGVGRQTLYFLPDRVLVFDSGSVGAVSYAALAVKQSRNRFIENEGVPSDSQVVGRTWRYVNKDGGPDRRFRDNLELPICEYEAIHFQSPSGLNELLHASKVGVSDALIRYLTIEGPRLSHTTGMSRPNVVVT